MGLVVAQRIHALSRRRSRAATAAGATTLAVMSQAPSGSDPLAGLDPRRREALESLWATFTKAGVNERKVSEELISDRRMEAAAEDSHSIR